MDELPHWRVVMRREREGDPDPARHMVAFTSDDLRADWQRLKALGVEFVQEPTDFGALWLATLKDPEGNRVQLFQFPPS